MDLWETPLFLPQTELMAQEWLWNHQALNMPPAGLKIHPLLLSVF